MSERGRVGPVAHALGFAGLLPQAAVVGCLIFLRGGTREALWPLPLVALIYPAVILSFLGGMWWTMALRRAAGQGVLAAVAVLPSLAATAFLILSGLFDALDLILAGLGSAIVMTLLMDRYLERLGEAPEGWMYLRVPLSLGLGVLTIAAGVLFAAY